MSKELPYLINPNFRLSSQYLHVDWYLVDNDILQTEAVLSDLQNIYRAGSICSLIAIRNNQQLHIIYSEQTEWDNRRLQNWIRITIRDYIISIANQVLPTRLHYWEREKNLYARQVKVVKLKKNTLGLCYSCDKTICLSPRIILLPEHDMDCIILHEMAHLKYRRHPKKFWNFLSLLIGEDASNQKVESDLRMYRFYSYSEYLMK